MAVGGFSLRRFKPCGTPAASNARGPPAGASFGAPFLTTQANQCTRSAPPAKRRPRNTCVATPSYSPTLRDYPQIDAFLSARIRLRTPKLELCAGKYSELSGTVRRTCGKMLGRMLEIRYNLRLVTGPRPSSSILRNGPEKSAAVFVSITRRTYLHGGSRPFRPVIAQKTQRLETLGMFLPCLHEARDPDLEDAALTRQAFSGVEPFGHHRASTNRRFLKLRAGMSCMQGGRLCP